MSEKLGPMQFGRNQGEVFLGRDLGHDKNYSDKFAYEIDLEIQNFIRQSYERCKELLTKFRDQLELVAQTLLVKETLDADEIRQLIENGKLNDESINQQVRVQIQSKNQEDKAVNHFERRNEDDDTEHNGGDGF
jgi:cell division protease FtsH